MNVMPPIGRSAAVVLAVLGVLAGAPLLAEPSPEEAAEVLRKSIVSPDELTDEDLRTLEEAALVETVEVSRVLVSAVVTDRRGRPVEGLTAKDFSVSVEGESCPISWFGEDQAGPFHVALLVDASGSMGFRGREKRLGETIEPLLSRIEDEDRVRLFAFAEGRAVALSSWMRDAREIRRRAVELPRGGRTAIIDALDDVLVRLPNPPPQRHAIVLVTDGLDNASRADPKRVLLGIQRIGVPVYVLAIGDSTSEIQARRDEDAPLRILEVLATDTGGRFFLVQDEEDARGAAERIAADLRHQYWLAFAPPPSSGDRFREIDVATRRPGLAVITRSGFR
jgi:Ca-activated chloride channel family protein